MTGALDPSTVKRLARVCAMFSCGELANAAAMADRIVRGMGHTWETLLGHLTDTEHECGITQDRTDAEHCQSGARYLNDMDLAFFAAFIRRIRKGELRERRAEA
jgi:hypothetical protein